MPRSLTCSLWIPADAEDAAEDSDAAERLGVSRSRIRQLLSAHRLYGVRLRNQAWLIPDSQFTDDQLTPSFEAVNRTLPRDCHPLAIDGFLDSAQPELELDGSFVSPLDWLRRGRTPEPVIALARAV